MGKDYKIYLNRRLNECDLIIQSLPLHDVLSASNAMAVKACVESLFAMKAIAAQTGVAVSSRIDSLLKACYERLDAGTVLSLEAEFSAIYSFSASNDIVLRARVEEVMGLCFQAQSAVSLDASAQISAEYALSTPGSGIIVGAEVEGTEVFKFDAFASAMALLADVAEACLCFLTPDDFGVSILAECSVAAPQPIERGIFLGGRGASDSNDGSDRNHPVATLGKAVELAPVNGTIFVLGEVSISGYDTTAAEGKNLTVKRSGEYDGTLLVLDGETQEPQRLSDLTIDGGGRILEGSGGHALIEVSAAAELLLLSVTLRNNLSSAISIVDAKLTMSGSSIQNCSSDVGGAVRVFCGGFGMGEASAISYCTATYAGGAIYASGEEDDSNELTIEGGCSIQNCSAGSGGAIFLNCGTAEIKHDALITNCSATDNGGAISLGEDLYVHGEKVAGGRAWVEFAGTITNCSAENYGGAIFLGESTQDSESDGAEGGGTAYFYDGAAITGCSAIKGGAVYISSGSGILDESNGDELVYGGIEISGNTALSYGGGIYLESGGEIMDGPGGISLSGNTAPNGAGIYCDECMYFIRRDGNVYIDTGILTIGELASLFILAIPLSFMSTPGLFNSAAYLTPDNGTIYVGFELLFDNESGFNDRDFEGRNITVMRADGYSGTLFSLETSADISESHEWDEEDIEDAIAKVRLNYLTIDGGGSNLPGVTGNLIHVGNYGLLEFGGSAVLQNNAASAIYADGEHSKVVFGGGCIQNCRTTGNGGGVHIAEGATLDFADDADNTTSFINNQAVLGGGIYVAEGAAARIICVSPSPFTGNIATEGAGAYIENAMFLRETGNDIYIEQESVSIPNGATRFRYNFPFLANSLSLLQDAIDALPSGGTIYIGAELKASDVKEFEIESNRPSGVSVARAENYDGTLISISSGVNSRAQVALCGLVIDGGGRNREGTTGSLICVRGASYVDEQSELYLFDTTLQNNAESAIHLIDNGHIYLADGTVITGCSAVNGGAIRLDGEDPEAEHDAYCYIGYEEDDEVVISDCHATNNGGGVYSAGNDFRIEMCNSEHVSITNCSAQNNVGCVYGYVHSMCHGATITNCSAVNGGGIYLTGGYGYIDGDSSITSCSATGNGGGVYIMVNEDNFYHSDYSEFEIYGLISGCSATNGGAVYLANAENSIECYLCNEGIIGGDEAGDGNSASSSGGGIYVSEGA